MYGHVQRWKKEMDKNTNKQPNEWRETLIIYQSIVLKATLWTSVIIITLYLGTRSLHVYSESICSTSALCIFSTLLFNN